MSARECGSDEPDNVQCKDHRCPCEEPVQQPGETDEQFSARRAAYHAGRLDALREDARPAAQQRVEAMERATAVWRS